jgi:Protein of unknown function (DUF229)
MFINLRVGFFLLLIYSYWLANNDERLTYLQKSATKLLFEPSTPLVTVSPIYKPISVYNTDDYVETSVPNRNYEDYKPVFSIDDTNKLSENANLTCNPSNFGYSVANGEFVFPDHLYPLCNETVKNYPEMIFDYKSNRFTMKCKTGTPYYVLEPPDRKGRLFQYSEMAEILKKIKYTGPVQLTIEEFAIGSCDGDLFNNGIHFPRLKKDVYDQALNKMESLKVKEKPLIVIMLTIDSYSRRHFFRKLPKTLKYLNSLNSSYAVFDFKLHNEFAGSSTENMVPIFSGIFY